MLKLYENIKSYRKQCRMTQEELAKRAGYSDRSSIAKIESGVVDLSQSKIAQFADIFGVTPGDLMGWDEASDQDIKNSDAKADITNRILEDDEFFALVDKLNRLNHDQFHDAEKILDLFFKQIFDQQKD